MKKIMLVVAVLALAFTVHTAAQTIAATTNFSVSNVTQANVAAEEATLKAETNVPSGATLHSYSQFLNPTTGNWTLTATYR